MKATFADTAYWVALVNSDDELHEAAVALSKTFNRHRRLVTSELVLIELLNYFSSRGARLRGIAAGLTVQLYTDSKIEVTLLRHIDLPGALKLYSERLDKDWSIVDCSSFVIMQQQKITEALTADKHFEQAGFQTLL